RSRGVEGGSVTAEPVAAGTGARNCPGWGQGGTGAAGQVARAVSLAGGRVDAGQIAEDARCPPTSGTPERGRLTAQNNREKMSVRGSPGPFPSWGSLARVPHGAASEGACFPPAPVTVHVANRWHVLP